MLMGDRKNVYRRFIGLFTCLLWVSTVYSFDMKAEYPIIKKAGIRNKCTGENLIILLAIRHAENGRKGYEYGITNPKAKNTCLDIQAGWAAATIVKNRIRWDKKGDFIEFLGSKYAPIGCDNDPNNLNINWVRNVRYWVNYYKLHIKELDNELER